MLLLSYEGNVAKGNGTQKKEDFVMIEYKVKISTINDVKKFVNTVSKYDFDVDLISGRYAIDAKSIMGIFSIDLSKELVMKAHTDNADVIKGDLADYIVG